MKGNINMKTKFMKAVTLCLALIMCFSSVLSVSAAEVADATINHENDCSLTIFKYDWTNAVKDGVWNNESFTSTGWQESYVESVLGGSNGSTLGNGQTAYGYALKGVEFTLLRVADIVTFTESTNDDHPEYNMTQVLYGFDKTASADLLKAIGLENGANRYENADATDKLDSNNYYYTSDVLNKALADAVAENATTVKNALESYIASSNGAVAMDLTNEYGKAKVEGLDTGLWLVLETKTSESITSTTAPFFVSLPMTTVSGDEGLDIMESILGLYIRKGGFALQFNVVSPDMLRDAQINPEKYKNLQVRLCGWNVYFNDLEREVQNNLIEGMANV